MQSSTATYFAKSQHLQVLSKNIHPSSKTVMMEELKEPTSALSQDNSLSHTNVSEFAESHCQTKKAHDLNFSEQEFNFKVEDLSSDSDLGSENQNLNSDYVTAPIDAPKRQKVRK